jgi:hypothetical protein
MTGINITHITSELNPSDNPNSTSEGPEAQEQQSAEDFWGDALKSLGQRNPRPPSKRSNKVRSGRASRRSANSKATTRAVGGYANDMQAIFAPHHLEDGSINPMCVVVNDAEVTYTMNLGGSTPSPARQGKGA